MDSIWRQNPVRPHLEVSIFGEVRSHRTKKERSIEKRDIGFVVFERDRIIPVHRLVAETFIPNPEGCRYVHHRNRDKFDNRLANLFWSNRAPSNTACSSRRIRQMTISGEIVREYESIVSAARENGFNARCIGRCASKKIKWYKGFVWQYVESDVDQKEIQGEIWSTFNKEDQIDVSNFGRVRLNGEIVGCKIDGLHKTLIFRKGKKSFRVARAVAELFVDGFDEKKFIEFKDGDFTNCRFDNLVLKEKQMLCSKQKRSVVQMKDRCFVARFDSIKEASVALGINKNCISKCCRGLRFSAGGFNFKFEE